MYLHHLCETGASPGSLTCLDVAITPRNARRALGRAAKPRPEAHPFCIYGWAVEVRNIARNWLHRADAEEFNRIVREHYRRLQCPTTATNNRVMWLDNTAFRQRALRLSKTIVKRYRGRISLSAMERHEIRAALAFDLSIKTSLPLKAIAQLHSAMTTSSILPSSTRPAVRSCSVSTPRRARMPRMVWVAALNC
jgi:hypothetical protein